MCPVRILYIEADRLIAHSSSSKSNQHLNLLLSCEMKTINEPIELNSKAKKISTTQQTFQHVTINADADAESLFAVAYLMPFKSPVACLTLGVINTYIFYNFIRGLTRGKRRIHI